MSPLPSLRARAAIPAAVTALMLAPLTVAAQPAGPRPVIDHAPRRVHLQGSATISGHLENGAPGDEVALQRRPPFETWRTVRVKSVNARSKVSFRVRRLRTTAAYRFEWADAATGTARRSDTVRVRVIPRLSLRVVPNDVFAGRRVRLVGGLYPKAEGERRVRLERRVRGHWSPIARPSLSSGHFKAGWRPRRVGRVVLRATFAGDARNTARRAVRAVRVYKRDLATWYGPGFYGNRTACGRRLRTETLGVAHRTLPCGTDVNILYRGRTITVPVIDRGPYSSANWDLTQETAERLRFSGRDTIGVTR
ncbi:MAG: septal ring lytic transglycosylase RlpA family protein [Actinomycetota bacterium]